jgi:hypothetical protein
MPDHSMRPLPPRFADEELRRRMALAEERLADLKAALEDMRAQRDAWQAMAQARIRPARTSAMSRWPWLRLGYGRFWGYFHEICRYFGPVLLGYNF